MFHASRNSAHSHLLAALFVAAAASSFPPAAHAQTPRIPPDARGYQTVLILQQAQRAREQARSLPVAQPARPVVQAAQPATGSVGVTVDVPTPTAASAPATRYVTIQGPDGEVRRFPLATGVEVQYRRHHIVLAPGESTTIRLTPKR